MALDDTINENLRKELAKKPITSPSNPFIEQFKSLGYGEGLAFGFNLAGTLIAQSLGLNPWVVSLAGPILEKPAFYVVNGCKGAYDYFETPKRLRGDLKKHVKNAISEGNEDLFLDIVFHDTTYTLLMRGLMEMYSEVPVGFLVPFAFGTGLVVATAGGVALEEGKYKLFRKGLRKAGFEEEKYLESRFYISADKNPQDVLDSVVNRFGLTGNQGSMEYYDRYFPQPDVKEYSGRKPKFRLRKRRLEDGNWMQTAQLVFTNTGRIKNKAVEQFNYFPQEKLKIYHLLNNQEMPQDVDQVQDEISRKVMKKIRGREQGLDINFIRSFATNGKEGLFVSTDKVLGVQDRSFYVVELKVYNDKKLLKDAMGYVMAEFPVMQVSHGKDHLVALNGS
ncbi:hypothetical protein HN385_01880 [archaeon]|jgi:hypothetical protein|nr:hypothetical protein [archaeon]MBT3450526.1 hypothetical protein [archaeon]MBT6869438.1 hypothetical protein [archaeon]MBT7192601.1 hypothetical protein [archaeon]MBT7380677.1 hypothetical protein [archaeon]